MPPVIDASKCNACGLCDLLCPLDVIFSVGDEVEVRYPDECWHCGTCRMVCTRGAVKIEFSPIMLAV